MAFPNSPSATPTRIRYLVVTLTTVSAVLLYLDRVSISIAERYLKEDLGLSDGQTSFMYTAFFLSYALAQVPSGFLGDRYGARRMLTLYILLWSLFTGLTGLATGFIVLLGMRLVMGAAQAGAYPTAGSLLSKWVPPAARGSASSVVALGGRIGGFFAPLLTALLMVAFVPSSTSSLLSPGDILNYPHLCRQLVGTESADARGPRILALLPEPTQHAVREAVARDATPADSDPLQVKVLAEALNVLLRQRDFVEVLAVPAPNLPWQGQQLLERPRAELTDAEVERLNRLALEAAYPQDIKKVYVAGWRPVMMVYGLAGLLVAAAFWLGFRDRPDLHPACNTAEIRLIETGQPASDPNAQEEAWRVPLKQLCRSGSMWLMCGAQMSTNVGWIFLITLLPRFFDEVHKVPIEMRGWYQSIPFLVGWVGMLGGGWLTDRLTRNLGVRWGRVLPLAASRFLAMGAYLLCLFHPDPQTALIAFCVVAFATDLGNPAVWAFMQDVGGRYVGSVLGWGNMWGNLGAAFGPPLMAWVVSGGQWHFAFLTCAVAFFISGMCSLGVDPTRPIVPREEDTDDRDPPKP